MDAGIVSSAYGTARIPGVAHGDKNSPIKAGPFRGDPSKEGSITALGFNTATTAYDSVNDFRRILKAIRKIAYSTLFPEKSHIVRFMESHQIIARIYFVSQILAFAGLILRVPKLWNAAKGAVHHKGIKRLDSSIKIIAAVGKIINALTITIAGMEAFRIGCRLGQAGLLTAAKVFQVTVNLTDFLGIVGTLMTGTMMVHKGIVWHKTHEFQKEFKMNEWYRSDGSYTSKEYQLFRKYCQTIDDKEAKTLGKYMRVEGDALRKALMAMTQSETPAAADLQKMQQSIDSIVGRLQIRKKVYAITIVTRIVNLATLGCIFVPVLDPLAAVLIAATGVSKVATLLFENIDRYKFENRFGMIDRPTPANWKVIDYAKWQIGWYEKTSPISRILNSGSILSGGLAQQISALSNIVLAVEAVTELLG